MPAKYRKHGDMPTQYEMYDDVDAYNLARGPEVRSCEDCGLPVTAYRMPDGSFGYNFKCDNCREEQNV